MEDKYSHSQDGQEVNGEDLNLFGRVAAEAEDRVFAELLRLQRNISPGPRKGILMHGYGGKRIATHGTAERPAAVVSTMSANGKVRVYPFRAVLGPVETPAANPKNSTRLVYSGVYAAGTSGWTDVQLDAAVAEPRWDLVYATLTVDADGPTVTRHIKGINNEVAPEELAVTKINTVTVNVLKGTEDATPERPALPSDSSSQYHFPLAYVYLPDDFGLSTTIAGSGQIDDVANVLLMASSVGGSTFRPGILNTELPLPGTQDLDGTLGGRPRAYLPSTWAGGMTTRLLYFDVGGAHPADGSVFLVDNSIDWRDRIIEVKVLSSTASQVAWKPVTESGSRFPSWDDTVWSGFCNTFNANSDNFIILDIEPTNGLQDVGGGPNRVRLRFSGSGFDGDLHADIDATTGSQQLLVWLTVSPQLGAFRAIV